MGGSRFSSKPASLHETHQGNYFRTEDAEYTEKLFKRKQKTASLRLCANYIQSNIFAQTNLSYEITKLRLCVSASLRETHQGNYFSHGGHGVHGETFQTKTENCVVAPLRELYSIKYFRTDQLIIRKLKSASLRLCAKPIREFIFRTEDTEK